jgi:hypothetical protein
MPYPEAEQDFSELNKNIDFKGCRKAQVTFHSITVNHCKLEIYWTNIYLHTLQ